MSLQILVVGAFEPELSPFRALSLLPNVTLFECGIGSVTAAAKLGRQLANLLQQPPASQGAAKDLEIIFVGSCGSCDSTIPLGTIVSANSVNFIDTGIATGQSFLPSLTSHLSHTASDFLRRAGVLTEEVLSKPFFSTPSITRDPELARKFSELTGACFENLELFGIATVCSEFGLPWSALSVVTNYTSADGHQEWTKNFPSASSACAAKLAPLLSRTP